MTKKLTEDDELVALLLDTTKEMGQPLRAGDILVIAASVVSRTEGRSVLLKSIVPSRRALGIGHRIDVDPRKVELALRDSERVVRSERVLITKRPDGLITDMSGIDESNVEDGKVLLLPGDPRSSALAIHRDIGRLTGLHVPVIIVDTQGRPWRLGAVGVAVGVAGMKPFVSYAGESDLVGNPLRGSMVCLADELAAASGLIMGQADEAVPAAIVRGIRYEKPEDDTERIAREDSENLFL
jgi:coenzyme F420-0:L-glutamate ligase/coenzyme F420-1:gamma-L-glutamate ligase